MSRTTRCVHRCLCGAELICADADHCAVGPFWECPTCELDSQDLYLDDYELDQQLTEQEPNRHEKH